jgi:phosphatidylinositol dimannoside acyltransferase
VRHRDSLEGLPPAPPETLGQRAAYWQYRAAWEAAARTPEPIAKRLPHRIGRAWYRAASSSQREQVTRNLRRIVPDASPVELRDLVRDAYVSYARYWIDSFRLHTMDAVDVVAASTDEGLEHIDAFRDSGKGGILATGHLGSWDVGAFFTTQRRWGLVAVAEVVEPRRLFERFVWLRRQAGIDVVPLVRGGDMLDKLERRVRDEGAVATLLADRDLTRKGPIVEFFGEPCRLPPGTAALARRTGRPVAAGAFMAKPDGFHGLVRAPIEVADLDVYDGTQRVAVELERLIAGYPDQWHVFVRNWLVDREPDHPVSRAWVAGRDWRDLARSDWEDRRPERPAGDDGDRGGDAAARDAGPDDVEVADDEAPAEGT